MTSKQKRKIRNNLVQCRSEAKKLLTLAKHRIAKAERQGKTPKHADLVCFQYNARVILDLNNAIAEIKTL